MIQPDVRDLGDWQLMELAVAGLLPLREGERQTALAEFDIGDNYNRRWIMESFKAGYLVRPSYLWARDKGSGHNQRQGIEQS